MDSPQENLTKSTEIDTKFNEECRNDFISSVEINQQANISYKKLDFNGSCDIESVNDIVYLDSKTDVVVKRRKDRNIKVDTFNENRISTSSLNADIFIWENPLHQCDSPMSASDNPLKNLNKNASTPDEQIDIEYDGGEIINETTQGKKSVTPIRLIRKSGDRSNNNSNRNSMILNESDSDEQEDLPSIAFKFHPNNPFYEANSENNPSFDNHIPTNSNQLLHLNTEGTFIGYL